MNLKEIFLYKQVNKRIIDFEKLLFSTSELSTELRAFDQPDQLRGNVLISVDDRLRHVAVFNAGRDGEHGDLGAGRLKPLL